MSLLSSRVIFPRESRDFAGKRYISIGLRTLHLMGIAGFAGFFLFALPIEIWRPFAILAVSSGIALIGVEIFSDGIWLLQLRGLAVILKLLILAMCFTFPDLALFGFFIIIALSGFFSHAPAKIRYYSPFVGKVVKSSSELALHREGPKDA
jgi:hypothetical protein